MPGLFRHLLFMALISTVGGLQQDISRKLGTVSTNTGWADKCLEWINDGIEDLTDVWPDAPWKQVSAVLTLAVGTERYQLSAIDASLSEIKDIRISAQNVAPRYLPPDQFRAQRPQSNVNGVPMVFTMFGDYLMFSPLPATADGAQIDYLKDGVTVSAASAVPPIPRRFIRVLSLYGQMQGLYDREDFTQAAQVEMKYENAKAKIRQRLKRRVWQQRRMVSVRELQANSRGFNDEITNMFFNN